MNGIDGIFWEGNFGKEIVLLDGFYFFLRLVIFIVWLSCGRLERFYFLD